MQDLLVSWFGESGAMPARVVIALIVVLLLIYAMVWVYRRFFSGGLSNMNRNRQPRLAVMDVTAVDARRRLILVRRDNVEHLLLVGGPTDLVVEQTIVRGVPVGTMGKLPQRQAPASPPPEAPRQPAPSNEAPPVPERPAARLGAELRSEPSTDALAAGLAATGAAGLAAAASRQSPPPVTEPMVQPERPLPRANPQPRTPRPAPEAVSVAPAPVRAPQPAPPSAPAAIPLRPAIRAVEPPPVADVPYVPPEPTRPDRVAEPVATAPIVATAESTRPVPVPGRPVAAPADEGDDYDDLARRLDEALRLDLGERGAGRTQTQRPEPRVEPAPTPYLRPSRGPAAKADAPDVRMSDTAADDPREDEVAPAQAPTRPQDRAKSVLGAAGSWFRSRTTGSQTESTEPASEPEAPRTNPGKAPSQQQPTRTSADVRAAEVAIPTVAVPTMTAAPEPTPPPVDAAPPTPVAPMAPDLDLMSEPVANAPASADDRDARMADDLERMLSGDIGADAGTAPAPELEPVPEPTPEPDEIAAPVEPEAPPTKTEAPPEEAEAPPAAKVEAPPVEAAPAAKAEAPPVAPPTPDDKPADGKGEGKGGGRDPDFTSLEDEMARLLDELAGDSRPRA